MTLCSLHCSHAKPCALSASFRHVPSLRLVRVASGDIGRILVLAGDHGPRTVNNQVLTLDEHEEERDSDRKTARSDSERETCIFEHGWIAAMSVGGNVDAWKAYTTTAHILSVIISA